MICGVCLKESPQLWQLTDLISVSFQAVGLCRHCQRKFHFLKEERVCPACCRRQKNKTCCTDCQKWRHFYPEKAPHEALLVYNEALASWMESYKFRGAYHLRFSFAQNIQQALSKLQDCVFVPIPLSPQRLQQRGFNQVTGLLAGAGLPYTELLVKSAETTPQSQRTRQERLQLPQVFQINPRITLSCQKVILIDDIYTTGTTLVQGQKALQQAGFQVVKTFSLAR